MAYSISPKQYQGNHPQGSPESTALGAPGQSTSSPLDIDIFKSLADKRANRDSNPPKRRGPKPDSKPALTRRQELNRQAQRTHRERKELYIKALEDEVLRLKELYSTVSQDKEKLVEENMRLKASLAQHGAMHYSPSDLDGLSSIPSFCQPSGTSPEASSTAGSHTTFSPSQSTAPSVAPSSFAGPLQLMTGDQMREMGRPSNAQGIDCEQAGIDFVLALEEPCMRHLLFLIERAAHADGDPCGHALMASCPPVPFQSLAESSTFGKMHTGDHGNGRLPGQGTWELSKADLSTLLDLSQRLDLDGEITPVMAWGMVLNHPRFDQMSVEGLKKLTEELSRKVRCYGFGAVLEEFELRDRL